MPSDLGAEAELRSLARIPLTAKPSVLKRQGFCCYEKTTTVALIKETFHWSCSLRVRGSTHFYYGAMWYAGRHGTGDGAESPTSFIRK